MLKIFQHPVVREQRLLLIGIAALVAIFFLQNLLGRAFYLPLMVIPAEVTASFHAVVEGRWEAVRWGAFCSLLTYAFLHGSIEHLAFNCLYLWVFAALTARLVGDFWMTTIFVFTAICGGILHVSLEPSQTIPMLGASGAVLGFEGVYLGLFVKWSLPDPEVWPLAHPVPPLHLAVFAMVGVAIDLFGLAGHGAGHVAYGAHVGGFVGGLFLACFILPRPKA